jgi:hypothetical protein
MRRVVVVLAGLLVLGVLPAAGATLAQGETGPQGTERPTADAPGEDLTDENIPGGPGGAGVPEDEGDEGRPLLWLAGLAVAAGILAVALRPRRRSGRMRAEVPPPTR